MATFDFLVYNKKTENIHYQSRNYDTKDIDEATALFKNDEERWRYDVLDVKIHIPKETLFYEGDFTTNQSVKRKTYE